MFEQGKLVVSQYIGWIGRGVVGLPAKPMGAQVGHDHPIAGFGQCSCVAIFDPVRIRVAEIAVN